MNLYKYIQRINVSSILISIVLIIVLQIVNTLSPTLIKWIALLLTISIVSSGLIILIKFSKKLSKNTLYVITSLGIFIIIFSLLILFSKHMVELWNILLSVFIIFLLMIQLNTLGWSITNHHFLIKILFLISLISNLFLASVFLLKLGIYEIKPYFTAALLISFIIQMIGVFIQNKTSNTKLINN